MDLHALLEQTLPGLGYELVEVEASAKGRLVRVLPEWRTRVTEVHAVYPARHNLPPRLTLFLDHLAKALNPPPWERK